MATSIQIEVHNKLKHSSAGKLFEAVLLDKFWERFWGLKAFEAKATKGQLIVGFNCCKSVHTFGMGQAIDIAAIDLLGEVVASYKHVERGSIKTIRQASWILERFSCDEEWFELGERIEIIKNPPR